MPTVKQPLDRSVDRKEGQGRGRGVGRGHARGHTAKATSFKTSLGRGQGRDRDVGREGCGRGQGIAALGQGHGYVGGGAGLSYANVPSHKAPAPALAPAPAPAPAPPPPPPRYPLLSQQKGHKSAVVLSGCSPKPLFVRKHKITIKWDRRFRDYVVKAGFYGLRQIGYVRSDPHLISALVERWRPETHSFHLPVGEMMVTLQDVGVLLGLPIDGEPIYDDKEYDWPQMVREYLGRDVDDHTFKNSTSIQISWLKREFEGKELDPEADVYEVECYVRAYMLMLLGSVLFTDISGGTISIRYLPFLRDLNEIGKYSWGSAVLAYLNKELCRVCRESVKQMSGPILLLQIWAWERFILGRPKVRPGVLKPKLGGHIAERRPPYGYLWSGYHDWTENPARVLSYYRDELEHLREYQVTWEPYEARRLARLPPICTSKEELWMYTGPVIHFEIVEPHNPRRVMRQFGKHQEVPPNPCKTLDDYPCSYKGIRTHVKGQPNPRDAVKEWRSRRSRAYLFQENRAYDQSTYNAYIDWYSANTIRHLQPAKAICPLPGDPRDLQYQIRAGNTHAEAEKIKELSKEAAKKVNEDVDEVTRAFARTMLSGLKDVMEILGPYDSSCGQLPAQDQAHEARQQQQQGLVAEQQQQQQKARASTVGSSSRGVDRSWAKRLRAE